MKYILPIISITALLSGCNVHSHTDAHTTLYCINEIQAILNTAVQSTNKIEFIELILEKKNGGEV